MRERNPSLRTLAVVVLAALAGALALAPSAPAAKRLVDATGSIQLLPGQGSLAGFTRVQLITKRGSCSNHRRIDVYRRDPSGATLIHSTQVVNAGSAGPSFDLRHDRYGLKSGDVLFAAAPKKVTTIRIADEKRKLACRPVVSPDVTIPPAA